MTAWTLPRWGARGSGGGARRESLEGGHGVEEGRRWADMALQVVRVAGELDRQGGRRRGRAMPQLQQKSLFARIQLCHTDLYKASCCKAQFLLFYLSCFLFCPFGWIFPNHRYFERPSMWGTPSSSPNSEKNTYQGNLLGHTCTNSNTSLSFPGSAHVTPYSAS